jgi:hypothetical protein
MRLSSWCVGLLLLPGCSGISGKWVGNCDFGDARYAYGAAVTLDLNDGRGSTVEGDLQFDMFDGTSFEGNIDGLRSDTYIELSGEFQPKAAGGSDTGSSGASGQTGSPYTITLTGNIDETVIEGDCSLKVPLGTGALTGELVLER